MPEVSAIDYGFIAAALAVAGVVMGYLAGLFGIGGGGILVPVLFEVFGMIGVDNAVRMHLAIGTSLAVIVPTSFRSYLSHRASGHVDQYVLRAMALPVVGGVAAGAVIASVADATVLKWIWVIVGGMLAIKFLFGKESWRLGTELPRRSALRVYGVFVGAVSALMSIGGGAFITTMMTLYGRSIHQGVGTASAFGPLIAIPGVLGFVWAGWDVSELPPGSIGYVSVLGAALIISTSVLAAPFGARLGQRWPRRKLEKAFGVFVAFVSLRFLLSLAAGA